MDKRNAANLVLYYEVYEIKDNFTGNRPGFDFKFLYKTNDEKIFKNYLRNKLQNNGLQHYTIINTYITDECTLIVNIRGINF